jgi:hypothetical protein
VKFAFILFFLVALNTQANCDGALVDLYLAKRSCLLENNSIGCEKMGALSVAFPALAGVAGGAAAQLYNRMKVSKNDEFGVRKLSSQFTIIQMAQNKATEISSAKEQLSKLDQETFGRTFDNDNDRNRFVAAKYSSNPAETEKQGKGIFDLKFSDKEGYARASAEMEKWNKAANSVRESNLQAAIQSAQDPLLKEALLEKQTQKPSGAYDRALKEAFGQADIERVQAIYDDEMKTRKIGSRYEGLSSRDKVIYDFLGSRNSQMDSVNTGPQNIRERIVGFKKGVVSPMKIGAGANAAGAVALFAFQMGSNAIVKNKLMNCQQELGLSELDLKLLSGNYFLFSAPKARSTEGLVGLTCQNMQLGEPEKVISESRLANGGQIPNGICTLIKNEIKLLDNGIHDFVSLRNVSCDGFKSANMEMKGEGFAKTFYYTSGEGQKIEIPFDSQLGWPDYTQAKIYSGESVDQMKTEDFRSRHQRHLPADLSRDNPNPRWDMKELMGCLDPKNRTEECRMQRSAVAARMYYAYFKENCADQTLRDQKLNSQTPTTGQQIRQFQR